LAAGGRVRQAARVETREKEPVHRIINQARARKATGDIEAAVAEIRILDSGMSSTQPDELRASTRLAFALVMLL